MGIAASLPILIGVGLVAAGPAQAGGAVPAPGPQQRPSQLQLRYPALCEPVPAAAQTGGSSHDSAGQMLRRAFDGLGEWQCGWQVPEPNWNRWALTLWGGAMSDGDMGESLLFSQGMRSEALGGVGVQGTIWKQRRLGLIVDANLIGHRAAERGNTPQQSFLEGTIGLGLRVYPNSWLSLTVVEGLSIYSERSTMAIQRGGNGRRAVNYLAFELDAAIGQQLSLVGRLHHRSGIYGTIDCGNACDNNAYLLGLRYRFGASSSAQPSQVPPQDEEAWRELDAPLEEPAGDP